MRPLYCPGCRGWHDDLIRDRGGNPRGCPSCQSLERHRLLAVLLPTLVAAGSRGEAAGSRGEAARPRLVLDVAPSRALDPALDRLDGTRRMRIDFDPAADGRLVDVRASVTSIPLPDAGVDVLICSHVLEHVPDDGSAMRELARVLAGDGLGVVIVPCRPGPTDEDPQAPPEERIRRFGQADHVRYYGDDVDDRLAAAGLAVSRFHSRDVVEPWLLRTLHLMPEERFWLVRRADSPLPLPTAADLQAQAGDLLDEMLGSAFTAMTQLRSAREEAARWQREADCRQREATTWQTRYDQLRGRPAVRAMLAVRRAGRRGRGLLGGRSR